MGRPKPMATVLSFTTPQGNIIAQAFHQDGPAGLAAVGGTWPRHDGTPATWALELGRLLRRNDSHLLLPDGLRKSLLGLHATTEAEALEALDRAALALEDFLEDFANLQAMLEKRVTGACEYGKTPELPLGSQCRVCGEDPADGCGRACEAVEAEAAR